MDKFYFLHIYNQVDGEWVAERNRDATAVIFESIFAADDTSVDLLIHNWDRNEGLVGGNWSMAKERLAETSCHYPGILFRLIEMSPDSIYGPKVIFAQEGSVQVAQARVIFPDYDPASARALYRPVSA
jgi:hypothetical protein